MTSGISRRRSTGTPCEHIEVLEVVDEGRGEEQAENDVDCPVGVLDRPVARILSGEKPQPTQGRG